MRLTCSEMMQLGLRTAEQCAQMHTEAAWILGIGGVFVVGAVAWLIWLIRQ